PMAALGYLLLFGLGTVVGMMLITLVLSAPFAFTAVNLPKFNWRLRVASGLVSFVFGVVLIYGFGFADGGLFSDAPTWEPRRPGGRRWGQRLAMSARWSASPPRTG